MIWFGFFEDYTKLKLPSETTYLTFKDCVIDADPILNDQHWSLHHAQLHSTPMSVFISKDKNGSLDELAKVFTIHAGYFLSDQHILSPITPKYDD